MSLRPLKVYLHVPKQMTERTLRPLSLVFAAWLITTSTVAAQPARVHSPDATGEWMVAKQIARIKIVDCDGRLWGVVAWEAQPGTDTKNPDPTLRNRPTLGLPFLLGMQPSKPNRWEGQIYNSEDGHTYSASISLVDPATLRVQGCFLGFLCGGENWTRVETQDTPAAKTPPKSTTGRKAATTQPEPTEDVCLKILGTTGFSHERGLK
jgi:uncharacterized protein (DUF2147 family)